MLVDINSKQNKKQRLICVNGYYSIINSVAVLRQMNNNDEFNNVLLISVDGMNRDSLYYFACKFKEFNEIIVTLYERKKGGYSNIKDKLLTNYFAEIILLFRGTYKYLLKQKIDADKIILCDEGQETYFDISSQIIYKNKIKDVYLTDIFLVWKNKYSNNLILHGIDENIINSLISELPQDLVLENNSVIFLSSEHSKTKYSISYNKNDIEIIKFLISKGYNVYYKSHPRIYLKSNSELIFIINSDKFFIIDAGINLLIETVIFYNKDKIQFIIGEDSSVLYLSYKIFNIPSFSIFPDSFNGLRQIRILKHLPKFKDFLDSKLSPVDFYNKEQETLIQNRERFDLLQGMIFDVSYNNKQLKKKNKNLKIIIVILLLLFCIFFYLK